VNATAPKCIVIGCEDLSALTDVAKGQILTFQGHYCARCYLRLADGERLEIDASRLVISHSVGAAKAGCPD
jgi:hypothetical protein